MQLKFTEIIFTVIILIIMTFTSTTAFSQIHPQPLTSALPAKSGTQTVTADWLLKLPKQIFEYPTIRWLDNSRLIYSYLPGDGKNEWQIDVIDASTGKHQSYGKGSVPKPSPDGKWIAFTKGEETVRQLWIMRSDGTKAKQISHIEGGLGIYQYTYDFVWSPDSKRIALEHQPFMSPWDNKKRPNSMIDIIDVTTGKSKSIGTFDAAIRNLSWMPNSEEVLFMKERINYQYHDVDDHEWVQSINVNNGEIKTFAQFDTLQQYLTPTTSPDGQTIAITHDADNPIFNFMPSISLINTSSANVNSVPPLKRLTYEIKLDTPTWSADGTRIFARRDYGAYKQIYAIDAKSGTPVQITNSPLNVETYALSPDGKKLAWIGQDAHTTRVIRVASSNGEDVKQLDIISSAPKDMALSEVREIDWQTIDYPERMRGLLFLPLNYQVGHRYPLIVDVHGGDIGAHIYMMGGIIVTTPLEWQMWTAKGYAVFVPEFRSSASFGSLAVTRDSLQNHDRLNGDLKDIESGVDALIANGIADKDRLVLIGHSAGGLRANWFSAVTHRYRAIISKEGWADELIQALYDPPSKRRDALFGGSPLEVPQNYLINSALYHSAGATTPTIFFLGNPELGGVDKYGTVKLLYQSLKSQGVETQYFSYLDEGHVFEKPANRKDVMERSARWIDEHMK